MLRGGLVGAGRAQFPFFVPFQFLIGFENCHNRVFGHRCLSIYIAELDIYGELLVEIEHKRKRTLSRAINSLGSRSHRSTLLTSTDEVSRRADLPLKSNPGDDQFQLTGTLERSRFFCNLPTVRHGDSTSQWIARTCGRAHWPDLVISRFILTI